MTDAPHHDSAAWLEVVHLELAEHNHIVGRGRRETAAKDGSGWYVRRTCPCHRHTVVSIAFATKAEAWRCLEILDDDYRQRAARGGYAA